MYGPKLNRDWVGLRVRPKRSVENRMCKLAPGIEGVVDHYSPKGICFVADGCETCGSQPIVSHMSRFDFDILTPPDEWPDTRGQGRKRR